VIAGWEVFEMMIDDDENIMLMFQNLNQNMRTLLPKFYGLYCYQVITATSLSAGIWYHRCKNFELQV